MLISVNKKEALKAVCEKYHISYAYLFGSQLNNGLAILEGEEKNNADPLTDIDLGLVFVSCLPDNVNLGELYANIYNDLSDIFLPFRLDLTFLEENHSVFQANAITGACIYSYNEKHRDIYEENVLRRAADFKPFLEKYLDEYLEEVLTND